MFYSFLIYQIKIFINRLKIIYSPILYYMEWTPSKYKAHGYKSCLGIKENFELALSIKNEVISNAIMNLMESSILAQDKC